jgi:hypothetical protein
MLTRSENLCLWLVPLALFVFKSTVLRPLSSLSNFQANGPFSPVFKVHMPVPDFGIFVLVTVAENPLKLVHCQMQG